MSKIEMRRSETVLVFQMQSDFPFSFFPCSTNSYSQFFMVNVFDCVNIVFTM